MKTLRIAFAGLALVAAIGFAPGRAAAVGFEDSLDECAYPGIFDMAVMRPISFAGLVMGTTFFVITAPIWATTVPRDTGKIANTLVGSPARFTFARPLGECTGLALKY